MSRTAAPLLLLLAAALLATCSAPPPTATPAPTPTPTPTPVATAETPIPVSLPKDDAPHPSYNTEWWYYSGHLKTEAGEQFAFHYVVFDVRYPGMSQVNIYQVAVTDHRAGTFLQAQRSVSAPVGVPPQNSFSYTNADWLIAGGNGRDRLKSTLQGLAFDLDLQQEKPAALHGGIGFLDFSPASSTYYYSRTRMAITGTLTRGSASEKVTGTGWFDHQWGNFRFQQGGWDWFALQLNDGTDVMGFLLRDGQGKLFHSYATVIGKDGSTKDITGDAIRVASSSTWASPTSGGTYPMGWRLTVDGTGIDVDLAPVIKGAEFDATSTTFNHYWEGPVVISGSHSGQGFVEMVGYAPFRLPGRS